MSPITLRVKELRDGKGWTQQELADKAKVSRVTIARMETRAPDRIELGVLERLADAFGVNLSKLLVHTRKRGGK